MEGVGPEELTIDSLVKKCDTISELILALPSTMEGDTTAFYIQKKLKDKNIGILITDHNVTETLSITDRAYLMFEGSILRQGTSQELADDPVVRKVYLGRNFELKKKNVAFEEE